MKHFINPQIDCVFKAILGSNSNKPVLIHFLNSIIKPEDPITSVDILNPYNEKEFTTDKLSIVDIKARDNQNRLIQIEIQIAIVPHLPARMLYNWSDIYAAQLQDGDNYTHLNPVISVWMLTDILFTDSKFFHHCFRMADLNQEKILNDHCAIHILELNKWQIHDCLSLEDQWLWFFRDAKHWSELPAQIDTPELKRAMTMLRQFSEKERAYHLYQSRQNAIREQSTQQQLLEEALQALKSKEEALKSIEDELKSKEEVMKELERLRALLKKSGIDPDLDKS